MCCRHLVALAAPAISIELSERAITIVSALLLNIIAFALAAEVLYRLSRRVLKQADLAWLAVCWFCITPAGIFMSAAYTER